MALVKNWQSFHIFTIGKNNKENVFKSVQERKKAFPDYRNNQLKKSKISDFSKGVSPWIWLKIANFSILYIIGKIGLENVLYDILKRKNAFLG